MFLFLIIITNLRPQSKEGSEKRFIRRHVKTSRSSQRLFSCSGFKCSKLNCGLRTTGKFTVLLTCTAALHALDTDGNPKRCVIVLTDQHVSDATDIIPKSKIFERLDL